MRLSCLLLFSLLFTPSIVTAGPAISAGWVFQVGNSKPQQGRAIIFHNNMLYGIGDGRGRPDRQTGVTSGSPNGDPTGNLSAEKRIYAFYYFALNPDGTVYTPTSTSDYTPVTTVPQVYIYADHDESCTYAWRYYRARRDCQITAGAADCSGNAPGTCPGNHVTGSCTSNHFCMCPIGSGGAGCTIEGPTDWSVSGTERVHSNPSASGSPWYQKDTRVRVDIGGAERRHNCPTINISPTAAPIFGADVSNAATNTCEYCTDNPQECERKVLKHVDFTSSHFTCDCQNAVYHYDYYWGSRSRQIIYPISERYHGQYIDGGTSSIGGDGTYDNWRYDSGHSWRRRWFVTETQYYGNYGAMDYCQSRDNIVGGHWHTYRSWDGWNYHYPYHEYPYTERACWWHNPVVAPSNTVFYGCSNTNFQKSYVTERNNFCTGGGTGEHKANYAKDPAESFYHTPMMGRANSLAPFRDASNKLLYAGGIKRCEWGQSTNQNVNARACNHFLSEPPTINDEASLNGHAICDSTYMNSGSSTDKFCFNRLNGIDFYEPTPPTLSSIFPTYASLKQAPSMSYVNAPPPSSPSAENPSVPSEEDSYDAVIWAKDIGYGVARVSRQGGTVDSSKNPTLITGGYDVRDEFLDVATDDYGAYSVGYTRYEYDVLSGVFSPLTAADVNCVDSGSAQSLFPSGSDNGDGQPVKTSDIIIVFQPLGTAATTDYTTHWRCLCGTPGEDQATGVALDMSHIYVVGFNSPNGVFGDKNAFLMKINKLTKKAVWAKYVETTDPIKDQAAWGVIISSDFAHVYIFGYLVECSVDLTIPRGYLRDMFIEKVATGSGDRIWAVQAGQGGNDHPTELGSKRLALDETNGWLWAVGRSDHWFDKRRVPPPAGDPLYVNTYRSVILRVSLDGKTVESGQYGNPSTNNDPGIMSVAVDNVGYVYFTGGIDWIFGTNPLQPLNNADLVVFKMPWCAAGSYPDNWSTCQQCTPGYHSPTDGTPTNYCIPCAQGAYSDSVGMADCLLCEKGFFTNVTGSTSCTSCDAGSFAPVKGSARCIPCAPGTVQPSASSPFCTRCDENTYQDEEGGTVCKACPGATTSYKASAALSDCKCSAGTYSGAGNMGLCFDCPSFATCARGTEWPSADPGYWLDPAVDPEYVHLCFPFAACADGGTNYCMSGYTGYACRECDTGNYRDRGWCKPCPTDPAAWIYTYFFTGVALLVTLFIVAVAVWCCIRKHKHREEIYLRLKAVSKIVESQIMFWSFLALIGIMDLRNLPESWATLFGMWSIFNLNLNYYVGAECQTDLFPASFMSHYNFWWQVRFALPFVLAFAWVILSAVIAIIHSCTNMAMPITDTPERKKRHRLGKNPPCPIICFRRFAFGSIQGGLNVLSFLFFPAHLLSMEVFRCAQQDPGDQSWVLAADPSMTCFDMNDSWGAIMPFAVVATFFYTITMFLIMNTIILANWSKKYRTRMFNARMFGFLWDKYEDKVYWWECVVFARKMLVGLALQGHYRSATLEMFFYFTINLVYTIAQVYASPYVSARLDLMEMLNLFCLLMLGIIMLMFHSDRVTEGYMRFCEGLAFLTLVFQLCVPVVFTVLILVRGRQGVDPVEELKKQAAKEKAAQELLSDMDDVVREDNPFGKK